jgi:hypothetical protein
MQESLFKILLLEELMSLSFFQLAISKRDEENKSSLYILDGSENLGSYLRIRPRSDKPPLLSKCSIHWYRLSSEGSWREVISGIYSISFSSVPQCELGSVESLHMIKNCNNLAYWCIISCLSVIQA